MSERLEKLASRGALPWGREAAIGWDLRSFLPGAGRLHRHLRDAVQRRERRPPEEIDPTFVGPGGLPGASKAVRAYSSINVAASIPSRPNRASVLVPNTERGAESMTRRPFLFQLRDQPLRTRYARDETDNLDT